VILRLLPLTGLLLALSACTAQTADHGHEDKAAPQTLAPQPSSRTAPDQSRVSGAYVVTAPGKNTAEASALLHGIYGEQRIRSIQPLGRDQYLLRIDRDPGPATMEALARKADESIAIQPNYIYRAPPAPLPKLVPQR